MGRMLSALKRIEAGHTASSTGDSVPLTQVVRASVFASAGGSSCLSAGAFWQPFDFEAIGPVAVAVAEPNAESDDSEYEHAAPKLESVEVDNPNDASADEEASGALHQLRTLIVERLAESNEKYGLDEPVTLEVEDSEAEDIDLSVITTPQAVNHDRAPFSTQAAECQDTVPELADVESPALPVDNQVEHEAEHAAIDGESQEYAELGVGPLNSRPLVDVSTDDDANDPYTEALGELTATILRKLPGGMPAALWVTSAGDAADASALVADLSQHLCEHESLRVLAVDAQAGRAASRVDCGLLEVLEEPARFTSAVIATAIEGLAMLPGGVGTPSRATSLDASFEPVLEAACREFDLVLVDGGLGSNPATMQLAADCDGAVMLVRLGETNINATRRLAKLLRKANVNVLGCVAASGD